MLSSAPSIFNLNAFEATSVQYHQLGAVASDKYGNFYKYAKNGGVALAAAHLIQEAAEDTQFVSMAVPAAIAIGQDDIVVTNGTTAVTANMFDNGHLTISTATGIGQTFRIISHTTGASGASISYKVDHALLVALDTTSKVSVRKNAYDAVIEYPVTTQTGGVSGFAMMATPISYYTWLGVGGELPVLFDTGTNSANGASAIAPSAAVAGSVAPVLDAVGAIVLGYSRQVVSVDSTVSIAHINLL